MVHISIVTFEIKSKKIGQMSILSSLGLTIIKTGSSSLYLHSKNKPIRTFWSTSENHNHKAWS